MLEKRSRSDPLYSTFKLFEAQAFSRLGKCPAAIENIRKIIAGLKGLVAEWTGLSIMAFCYVEVKAYKNAIKIYEGMIEIEDSKEVRELLKDAAVMSTQQIQDMMSKTPSSVSVK